MELPFPGQIRAFISYSHDSEVHASRVANLATRLRDDGIDCDVDLFENFPAEGWPMWMATKIEAADFVIVVCTDVYLRRLEGREQNGVGKGAGWEGAIITQSMYEAGGKNSKFIPVIFEQSDKNAIPIFLRKFTYYNLGRPDDYLTLYGYLTGQPKTAKPPLGTVKLLGELLPPEPQRGLSNTNNSSQEAKSETQVLILVERVGLFSVPALEIERSQVTSFVLSPSDAEQSDLLLKLQSHHGQTIGVAFNLVAFAGEIGSIRQRIVNNKELFDLTIVNERKDYLSSMSETMFGKYSADEIATMRARRILLNEFPPVLSSGSITDQLNEATLETFIRGINTPLKVERSPFPALFKDIGHDRNELEIACRLVAILELRLTGTIESVRKFKLELTEAETLRVEFVGVRPRKYVNEEPAVISVMGDCNLKP